MTTSPQVRTAGSRASADRLGRLLNLVPYLLARPGIEIAQAAADLGVTERQLREDLELLWVCGLPGYGPVDAGVVGDRDPVTVERHVDQVARPVPRQSADP